MDREQVPGKRTRSQCPRFWHIRDDKAGGGSEAGGGRFLHRWTVRSSRLILGQGPSVCLPALCPVLHILPNVSSWCLARCLLPSERQAGFYRCWCWQGAQQKTGSSADAASSKVCSACKADPGQDRRPRRGEGILCYDVSLIPRGRVPLTPDARHRRPSSISINRKIQTLRMQMVGTGTSSRLDGEEQS